MMLPCGKYSVTMCTAVQAALDSKALLLLPIFILRVHSSQILTSVRTVARVVVTSATIRLVAISACVTIPTKQLETDALVCATSPAHSGI